jgi:hypothetical protein
MPAGCDRGAQSPSTFGRYVRPGHGNRNLAGDILSVRFALKKAYPGPQMEQEIPPGIICARTIDLRTAIFRRRRMNGIIYLVGLIVVIMAVLSFFGLR